MFIPSQPRCRERWLILVSLDLNMAGIKSPRSAVRLHRILGGLAVLHAVVLSGWNLLLYNLAKIPWPTEALWAGVATLWLLWPVVLALHSGRSFVRFLVPLIVAVPFLLLRMPFGVAPVR